MEKIKHMDYIESHGIILANKLLEWYHQNKRDLPWRRTHNPYAIWISEVMLQQTQVDTVINYYINFLERFPTVKDLADASEDEVLKIWAGLGYYSRARRLRQTAIAIMQEHHGDFPKTYEEALKLPGIGPYTAGAVLSIAYNLSIPAVDGNVLRVFSRLFNDHRDISDPKTRQSFEKMAKALLPDDCRHFNQSLMELGACICLPKNPKCEICPIHSLCLGHANNCARELPVKKEKTQNIQLQMEAGWVTFKDFILLVKRPSEGLLASLWGLPITQRKETLPEGISIQEELEEYLGTTVKLLGPIKKSKHIFSHRTWNMTLYQFEIEEMISPDYPEVQWVKHDKVLDYGLPTAFKKLIP